MYFMRFKQLLNLKAYIERNCTFFLWNADLIKYSFNLFRLSNLHSSRRFKDTYYLKYYSLVLKFHQSFKKASEITQLTVFRISIEWRLIYERFLIKWWHLLSFFPPTSMLYQIYLFFLPYLINCRDKFWYIRHYSVTISCL